MKTMIATDNAPGAVGPYAQAVAADGWLWVSMQLPLSPVTGKMVEGSITDQLEQVFTNVAAILEAGGSRMELVVRTTLYLADMDDFAEANGVYARHFPVEKAARAALQAVRLPLDARVAIDAVARIG